MFDRSLDFLFWERYSIMIKNNAGSILDPYDRNDLFYVSFYRMFLMFYGSGGSNSISSY